MREPPWISEGRRWVGVAEIPGTAHQPRIQAWLRGLRAWWTDDETPWCGVFAAHCMRTVDVALPKHWYRAKGWLDWGLELDEPLIGSVAVFDRKGGGHVGFVVGQMGPGVLAILGGNQGNQVSVAAFSRAPISYRWPWEYSWVQVDYDKPLPIVSAAFSRSES